MTALVEILFKALPYLLALSVAFAIGASGWRLGVDQTESRWQAEWNDRDARDAQAVEKANRDSRQKEQSALNPLADDVAQPLVPDNLDSHRDTWLQAFDRLIELEPMVSDPQAERYGEREYWEHERQAMLDMYVDLDRLNKAPATAESGVKCATCGEPTRFNKVFCENHSYTMFKEASTDE